MDISKAIELANTYNVEIGEMLAYLGRNGSLLINGGLFIFVISIFRKKILHYIISQSSMVSQSQHNTFKNASDSYLSHEDFGIWDIENVMSEIFGSERAGEEAVSWTHYWNELNVYEECLRVTHNGGDPGDVPKVCTWTLARPELVIHTIR
jgi:hypothetical protein